MPSFLQETLTSLRGTPFDTPARQRMLRVTQVSWRAPDGSYLVPDAAVSVMGSHPRLWPPLVVEVANTLTYESATAKVARWFIASERAMEVALLMKFTAANAMVDPACFVEVWRSRVGEVTGGNEDSVSPAASGSCTSKNEDIDQENVSPAASASCNCEDVDSADEDLDPAVVLDPDAEYGSSTQEITVYRDGPRRIVYPAPEPPVIQAPISLRYSDFFGRENVPVGRDPGEEVLLDLGILREVLAEFVDLTRAQVASIKRQRDDKEKGMEVEEVEALEQNSRAGKMVRR